MLRHYLMLLSTTLHHCNYPRRLSSPLGLQSIPCPHTCTSHTTTAATIPPPSSKCLQAAHMSLSFTTVGHEHIASCCKHITGMSQHPNRGWGSADGLGGGPHLHVPMRLVQQLLKSALTARAGPQFVAHGATMLGAQPRSTLVAGPGCAH